MSVIPVKLQTIDATTETWSDVGTLHALQINKRSGGEDATAGAERARTRLTFDFRWRQSLETAALNPQTYRLVYRGHLYNIVDYDVYMEQRDMIRIVGELYGS